MGLSPRYDHRSCEQPSPSSAYRSFESTPTRPCTTSDARRARCGPIRPNALRCNGHRSRTTMFLRISSRERPCAGSQCCWRGVKHVTELVPIQCQTLVCSIPQLSPIELPTNKPPIAPFLWKSHVDYARCIDYTDAENKPSRSSFLIRVGDAVSTIHFQNVSFG